ncbi:hypothetical protein V6N12_065465 [Hibiscus sabdariffa]|uniref:Uncharacterized protein n=1 Tax=Hibiscus sabdariffa TaxID=183260 RepID=A0ABR2G988_9ROSI
MNARLGYSYYILKNTNKAHAYLRKLHDHFQQSGLSVSNTKGAQPPMSLSTSSAVPRAGNDEKVVPSRPHSEKITTPIWKSTTMMNKGKRVCKAPQIEMSFAVTISSNFTLAPKLNPSSSVSLFLFLSVCLARIPEKMVEAIGK